MFGKDKHSSLYCLSNKDEEKGFYCIDAGKVERWTPEKRNGEKWQILNQVWTKEVNIIWLSVYLSVPPSVSLHIPAYFVEAMMMIKKEIFQNINSGNI